MKVLVCGGRDFNDLDLLCEELTDLWDDGVEAIIHGGARGADSLAGEYARLFGIEEIVFPADWKQHGRSAGPIRNRQMLNEGKPDLVVAFPGGRGTANMIEQARAAGVEVKIVVQQFTKEG